MDALTVVMSLGVVVVVGLYVYRMMQRSRNPTDLPPGSLTVDQFYEQNPLRRTSAEIDLGDGWRASDETRCTFSIFWIEDTGEVYALRVPKPVRGVHDGVGDYGFGGTTLAAATVEILGHARTRTELEARLDGRESKLSEPDGVGWIKTQLSVL